MSQQSLEYTCVRDWHSIIKQNDKTAKEAWLHTLPFVLSGGASQMFLWFIVGRLDAIGNIRRGALEQHPSQWAYVDCALQLVEQSKASVTAKAHGLATSNALCPS